MLMAISLSFIRLFFPGEEYKRDGQWTKGYAHGAPEDRVGATSFGDRVTVTPQIRATVIRTAIVIRTLLRIVFTENVGLLFYLP